MARLYLTGGLRLDGASGTITDADLPGQQGRVAFAALAVERRPLSHDQLAEIVWDEMPPAQWKSALTPIVSKLRSLLVSVGFDGRAMLPSTAGAYELRLPGDTWVDVEDALRRLDRSEGALRHGELDDAAREATVASSILRRPFLVGVDNLWADGVRSRLADARYRCVTTLATTWHELGDHQLAATAARAAIEIDPLRELGHRLLVRAERARGDHSAALRAYDSCVEIFATELGATPSAATRCLVDGLRHGGPDHG